MSSREDQGGAAVERDVGEGEHGADHHRRAGVVDAGHAGTHVGMPGRAVDEAARGVM